MNSLIKKFEQNLIQIINNSNLPVGIVYYILKDMTNEIGKVYNDSCTSEEGYESSQSEE